MLKRILASENMNRAYLRVKRNHGSGGVDGMSVDVTSRSNGWGNDYRKLKLSHYERDCRQWSDPLLSIQTPHDKRRLLQKV